MTAEATISSHILYYTCIELQARGIAMEGLPQWPTVIRPVLNMQRPRVSFAQSQDLIQRALALSKDPDLGVAVGRRQTIGSAGLLASGLLASATCGDALALGVKYHRITGSMLDLLFQKTTDDVVMLRTTSRHPTPQISAFLVQELFTNITQIARFLYGQGTAVKQVHLMFTTRNPALYRTTFGCPVLFGQTDNTLVFSSEVLAAPLDTADAYALPSILAVLDSLMAQEQANQSFLAHIEHLLIQQIAQSPTMEHIARSLGMTERTLRRKLTQAGVSYSELLDRVRQGRAVELLETDMPLADVAQHLGFEDTRSLRRKVQGWTGHSPKALRQLRR
ncbi:MAG: AraC family transcriptional regulator [Pelagimonas sp.]|jgi:AraC-like DNA-binding protein|nr:AraC family transcriptional regulator [Pelagimonas sp.]